MTQPTIQRSIQRVTQTFIILLTLYYTLLGGFFVGVHEARWRVITYALSAVIIAGWLISRLRHRKPWPRTRLDWPLLAVAATMSLSTLFSTDPRLSLDSLLMLFTYGLCFYFAIDLAHQRSLIEKIINAMLLTALVICLVGLFEYWQWYYGDWLGQVNFSQAGLPWSLGVSRRIKSVLNNPNILAYYLLPILGLSLYKLGCASKLLARLSWGMWLLLVLGVIFLTQSRGGLLGTFAVLLTFGGIQFWVSHTRSSSGPPRKAGVLARRWLLLGAIALLGLGLLLWPIIWRTFSLTSLNLAQRDAIWKTAFKVIQTYPWLGSGPGTFGQQYLIFRETGGDFLHSHAHNLWLTFTAEGGLIGLAAILWLNLAFILTVPLSLRSASNKSLQTLQVAALAALAGMGLHNLLDDFPDYPMLTLYVIFLVALCLTLPESNTNRNLPPSGQNGLRQTIVAIILALIIGLAAGWFLRAFIAYDAARIAAARGDWSQAAPHLEQAVSADPAYQFYRQQLALVYGRLASKNPEFLSQAITTQNSIWQQPNHYALDYANLACLYRQAGNLPAAIEAMARAAAIEPAQLQGSNLRPVSRLAYQFSLIQFYEQAGRTEAAQQLLREILINYPWVAASPFWRDRPQELQTLIQQVETSSPKLDALADLYYYAGNYQQSLTLSRRLLEGENEGASTLIKLGRVLAQLGALDEALTVINQVLAQDPYHSEARLIRAQILGQQHNFSAAKLDMAVVMFTAPTAEAYSTWGQLAEQQGLLATARERYWQAMATATALETNYAHLVWRREPLPEETLPCLLAPYTEQELSQPALALGRLLEREGNSTEAAKVYELLLRYEPYNSQAHQRLAGLAN